MILPTAEIAAMTAQEKADLVEKRGAQFKEARFEAAITLALLKRSNEYAELKFQSAEELAEKKGRLECRDWSLMLSVGKRALAFPELDVAFRDGRLNWSKIRALIPVVDKENVKKWIDLATRLTSNQVEREVSKHRDPSVGGPTHAVHFRNPCYAILQKFANGVRLEARSKTLSDEDCVMRLLEELADLRKALFMRDGDVSATVAAQVAAGTSAAVDRPANGSDPSRHVPAGIRRQAMIRARFVCELCKNRFGAELHHVIPFSEGGTHAVDNLVVVCHACHQKLHDARRRDAQSQSHSPVIACTHAAADDEPGKPGKPDKHGECKPVREEEHRGGQDVAGHGCAPAVEASQGEHGEDVPPGIEASKPSRDRQDQAHSPKEMAVRASPGTSPGFTSRMHNDEVRPTEGLGAPDDERDLRPGADLVAPPDPVSASDDLVHPPRTPLPLSRNVYQAASGSAVAMTPHAAASSP